MTRQEALALARAKWGKDADILTLADDDNNTIGFDAGFWDIREQSGHRSFYSVNRGSDLAAVCRAAGLLPDTAEGK